MTSTNDPSSHDINDQDDNGITINVTNAGPSSARPGSAGVVDSEGSAGVINSPGSLGGVDGPRSTGDSESGSLGGVDGPRSSGASAPGANKPAQGAGQPQQDDTDVQEAEMMLEGDFAVIAAERDDYLKSLQQLQADFDNYRKRVAKQVADSAAQGQERLVEKLLPVLDTLDLAKQHGEGGTVESVQTQLLDSLGKSGLEVLSPLDKPFNPAEHDAVAHEEGDGGGDGPIVVEVMRTGYRWNGRVIRAAMVKVRG